MSQARQIADTILETADSKLLPRIMKAYSVSYDAKGAMLLTVTTVDDWPFRIAAMNDNRGGFILSQKIEKGWVRAGYYNSLDSALAKVIERHNRSLHLMPHWEKI